MRDFGKRLGSSRRSANPRTFVLLLGDIRRLRNPVMHCAFSRDCEARRPLQDSKFSLSRSPQPLTTAVFLSSLSLSICHPNFLFQPLSLSRQMATITYMCQYITHTASRASFPPLPQPFFDKVHQHRIVVRLLPMFPSDTRAFPLSSCVSLSFSPLFPIAATLFVSLSSSLHFSPRSLIAQRKRN